MIARTLSQLASQQAAIPWMACAGLLLFAAVFAGVLFWTARREGRSLYRDLSRLPLRGDGPDTAGREATHGS